MSVDLAARREQAYARLAESRRLGGALLRERDATRVHAALTRIVANCHTTLRELGGAGDPYVVSHTRMYLAAAHVDLAAVESRRDRRALRVEIGLAHARAGVAAALGSGTPFLPLIVLPWALVVLTGALASSDGAQRVRLQRLMATCARSLPRVEARRRRAARRGSRILFEGQALSVAADAASDPRQRAIVLGRARELARDARRMLLGAGDLVAAGQAERTTSDLDRALA